MLNPFEYANYINELYGDGNANNSNNPILEHIFDDTLLSITQDNTTSMTGELEESLKGLVDAPGYDNDVDGSEATEIVIDFTNPAYEQLREQYSFWKDGHTIAKDLADYIMVNYPVIAKKCGYDRLVNEIDLHYKLYRLGYKTWRTGKCNISISNNSSFDLIDGYTQFENALGEDFELPK